MPLCPPLPSRDSRLLQFWRFVHRFRDGSCAGLSAACMSVGAKDALQHSRALCERVGSIHSELKTKTECSAALVISWVPACGLKASFSQIFTFNKELGGFSLQSLTWAPSFKNSDPRMFFGFPTKTAGPGAFKISEKLKQVFTWH